MRLTPRSAVVAVALLGATLLFLQVVLASQRVLGWIAAAAATAALLHPTVAALEPRLRRGAAVALVALVALTFAGGVTFGVVSGLATETRRLQRAAPRAAEQIEREGPFRDAARSLRLSDRTRRFVDEVPERLRGGSPAEALRAATTRGVAFLATGVLALFFLLHGPRLAHAAAAQVRDDERREQVTAVAVAAYRRAFGYASGTIAMAVSAGIVAYAVARAAGVPGAAPLAVWVALWDAVPLLGLVVGGLPLVALAAVSSLTTAVLVLAVLAGYQVFEALVLQRRLERATMRLGPFLSVASGLVGLELYGIGGALLLPLGVALAVAVTGEVTARRPAAERSAG